jgi:hypothetical protein
MVVAPEHPLLKSGELCSAEQAEAVGVCMCACVHSMEGGVKAYVRLWVLPLGAEGVFKSPSSVPYPSVCRLFVRHNHLAQAASACACPLASLFLNCGT